jgi:DNA polymerase
MPDGPVPARIAFVGEEPGERECSEGKGFIGPSGQLLWQMANEIGLERQDVWVSNAALCAARKVTLPNGAIIPKSKVKAQAAQACRSRLLGELITVDPIVIVPLGNWALAALSGIQNARIYAYRGSRLEIDLRELIERMLRGDIAVPTRFTEE